MKKIIVVFLCFVLPLTAFAEPFRVYDNADLFSPEEEIALENAIKEYRWETKSDFVILTTDDFLGKNNQLVVANEFYQNMGFGTTETKDGLILYIDMSRRAPSVSTYGCIRKIIKDEKIDRIFDNILPMLSNGKYAEAMQSAINEAIKMYNEYWQEYISE